MDRKNTERRRERAHGLTGGAQERGHSNGSAQVRKEQKRMRRERRRGSSGADPKKSPGSTVISNEGSRQAARSGQVGRCTSPDSGPPGVRCQLSPGGNGGRGSSRNPACWPWDPPSPAGTDRSELPRAPRRSPKTRRHRIGNIENKGRSIHCRETRSRNGFFLTSSGGISQAACAKTVSPVHGKHLGVEGAYRSQRRGRPFRTWPSVSRI